MAAKASENSQAVPLRTLEPNKPAGVAGDVASLCWMEFDFYSFPPFIDAGGILLMSVLILGLYFSF